MTASIATTIRYVCPLDCGWSHDHDPNGPTVTAHAAPDASPAEVCGAFAEAQFEAQLADTESALRAHLETHTLEHWVRALAAARDRAIRAERAVVAVDAALQRADLGPALAAAHDALAEWKGER